MCDFLAFLLHRGAKGFRIRAAGKRGGGRRLGALIGAAPLKVSFDISHEHLLLAVRAVAPLALVGSSCHAWLRISLILITFLRFAV
jgi:hypothetical protein